MPKALTIKMRLKSHKNKAKKQREDKDGKDKDGTGSGDADSRRERQNENNRLQRELKLLSIEQPDHPALEQWKKAKVAGSRGILMARFKEPGTRFGRQCAAWLCACGRS